MSLTGKAETEQYKPDEYTQVHLVLTTYREDPARHALFVAMLESLAAQTRVPAVLWLMDEGSGPPSNGGTTNDGAAQQPLSSSRGARLRPPLPDVRGMLAGTEIELGAICQSGGRIGQAGQFNRGYALVEDAVRQSSWPYRTYLVKLEDDFEFTEFWLRKLISVWHSPDFATHNIGMLGGANGERGPVVEIAGHPVRLTFHVAGGCMFAPLALWRQYLPIPNRGRRDEQGGPTPTAAVADWHITRRSTTSVLAYGRRCGQLKDLLIHRGGGQSTWRDSE